MSQTEVRILLTADSEAITAFEKTLAEKLIADPMEREMQSWTAPWRMESLNHYLPQGWSFGFFNTDGILQAYLIAQPFLFYRGLTQTLWVEHLAYTDEAAALAVLDVTHRWARDKHLQCVLLQNSKVLEPLLPRWPAAKTSAVELVQAKSARF